MIGVGKGLLRNVPCLVPTKVSIVKKDPHQLRNRHGGMGIVELNGNFIGKRVPIVADAEAAYQIGERTGDEEIFLHEAQRLASACGIVGIEDAGDGFGRQGLRESAHEIATAEFLKVKVIRARPRPTGEEY